jgi:hypothetical protein
LLQSCSFTIVLHPQKNIKKVDKQQVVTPTKTEKLIAIIEQHYKQIVNDYRVQGDYRDIPFLLAPAFEKIWTAKIKLLQPILNKAAKQYHKLFNSSKPEDFETLITFNKNSYQDDCELKKVDFEKDFQQRIEREVAYKNRFQGFENVREKTVTAKEYQVEFKEICNQLLATKYSDEAVFKQLNNFCLEHNSRNYHTYQVYTAWHFIHSEESYKPHAIRAFGPQITEVLAAETENYFDELLLNNCNEQFSYSYRNNTNFEMLQKSILAQYNVMYKLIATFEKYQAKQNQPIFATHIFNMGVVTSKYNDRIHKYRNFYTVFQNNKAYKYTHESGTKELQGFFLTSYTITNAIVNVMVTDTEKVIRNTTLNINKDVQRVEVIDELEVHIFMHKHFDAEIIIMNSYEEALQLQEQINNARTANRNQNNYRKFN